MSFLDGLLMNLPEVSKPTQKRLSFKEKLKWTGITLGLFFVLGMIPLFGLGWMIYVVIKISESLKLEFESRGIHSDDPQFGYGIGLGYAICACAQILFSPVGIATLILWIIYWVKMNNYYKILNQSNQLES